MNKYQEYQEAVKELKLFVHSELDGTRMLDGYLKYCDILQELVDKTKTPTLEEVKKEWEELGYEWCASNNNKHIVLAKEVKNDMYNGDYTKIISINSITKTCSCYIDESYSHDAITYQEHQLLTKTFKALGW